MKTGPFGLQIGLSFENINLDLSPVESNPFRFTTKNVKSIQIYCYQLFVKIKELMSMFV